VIGPPGTPTTPVGRRSWRAMRAYPDLPETRERRGGGWVTIAQRKASTCCGPAGQGLRSRPGNSPRGRTGSESRGSCRNLWRGPVRALPAKQRKPRHHYVDRMCLRRDREDHRRREEAGNQRGPARTGRRRRHQEPAERATRAESIMNESGGGRPFHDTTPPGGGRRRHAERCHSRARAGGREARDSDVEYRTVDSQVGMMLLAPRPADSAVDTTSEPRFLFPRLSDGSLEAMEGRISPRVLRSPGAGRGRHGRWRS